MSCHIGCHGTCHSREAPELLAFRLSCDGRDRKNYIRLNQIFFIEWHTHKHTYTRILRVREFFGSLITKSLQKPIISGFLGVTSLETSAVT